MALCPQFLSVQRWMNCSHLPPSARTRWVTERIASLSCGSPSKRPKSKDETTGSSSACETNVSGSSESTRSKKENWERKLFCLLTPALMGDTRVDRR